MRQPYRHSAGLLIILLLMMATTARGQSAGGAIGIQASLQGSQTEIAVPIRGGDSLVVEPYFSLASVSDTGKDLGFGALIRINLREGPTVPYAGLRLGILHFRPEEGDGITDYVVGIAVGGEHFLAPNFSLGVEAQVNMALSDEMSGRFGNPDGTNINTASMATATFYF